MKRTLIIVWLVSLLLGTMACQIGVPTQNPGLPTIGVAETQTQPTQTTAVPLPPTETIIVEPTLTATNSPPTPTVDPVLDTSQLVLESRTHSEENTALPGYRFSSTFPIFAATNDERLIRFNQTWKRSSLVWKILFGQMRWQFPTIPTLGRINPHWRSNTW